MQDNVNKELAPDAEEVIIYTLTDEDTGEECDYELLAEAEIDGQLYYAMAPADDEEAEEYVILRVNEQGEELIFESIDDDDEFEKVEDYFNDLFFNEVDYDKE